HMESMCLCVNKSTDSIINSRKLYVSIHDVHYVINWKLNTIALKQSSAFEVGAQKMLTGQQTTIRAASVDDSDGTDFEAGHDDDDDLECIWLKDSDVSWLENWWNRKVD